MGNKQSNVDSKKDPRLFDVNAKASDIYMSALKEKDRHTQAELFRHAGLLYRDDKDHEYAGLCFKRCGELFSELEETIEAGDAYQDAFTAYSMLGSKFFEEFKDCCDEAISLTSGSKHQRLQQACTQRIGDSILRITDGLTDKAQIKELLYSGLFNRYLKNDQYNIGFKKMLSRFKTLEIQDMRLWSIFLKQGVDHNMVYLLDLTNNKEIDDELCALACGAVLCAYLYSFQPNKTASKSKSPTDSRNVSISSCPRRLSSIHSNNDNHNDSATFYAPEPEWEEYIREFRVIDVFTNTGHQCVMNIIGACKSGDLEQISDQFRELYATRRKNNYNIISYLADVYEERFTAYLEHGIVNKGVFDEERWVIDVKTGQLASETAKSEVNPFDDVDIM